MTLESILQFAKSLISKGVDKGDYVIDCTVGNGHDTVFLANLVGEKGTVFGFDIQETAIKKTAERLESENLDKQTLLYRCGHEKVSEVIPDKYLGEISGAMFNLGYLPGSDHEIVTRPDTTIAAIEQLLEIMKKGSLIVIVVYHGHEAGLIERDQLMDYLANLDQKQARVLKYNFINQKNNPPFVIAIEKLLG